MTNREIMVQILSEVSGKSKKEISELFDIAGNKFPGAKLNDEVPDHEAKKLMAKLREESSGILMWLTQGALEVER